MNKLRAPLAHLRPRSRECRGVLDEVQRGQDVARPLLDLLAPRRCRRASRPRRRRRSRHRRERAAATAVFPSRRRSPPVSRPRRPGGGTLAGPVMKLTRAPRSRSAAAIADPLRARRPIGDVADRGRWAHGFGPDVTSTCRPDKRAMAEGGFDGGDDLGHLGHAPRAELAGRPLRPRRAPRRGCRRPAGSQDCAASPDAPTSSRSWRARSERGLSVAINRVVARSLACPPRHLRHQIGRGGGHDDQIGPRG